LVIIITLDPGRRFIYHNWINNFKHC